MDSSFFPARSRSQQQPHSSPSLLKEEGEEEEALESPEKKLLWLRLKPPPLSRIAKKLLLLLLSSSNPPLRGRKEGKRIGRRRKRRRSLRTSGRTLTHARLLPPPPPPLLHALRQCRDRESKSGLLQRSVANAGWRERERGGRENRPPKPLGQKEKRGGKERASSLPPSFLPAAAQKTNERRDGRTDGKKSASLLAARAPALPPPLLPIAKALFSFSKPWKYSSFSCLSPSLPPHSFTLLLPSSPILLFPLARSPRLEARPQVLLLLLGRRRPPKRTNEQTSERTN